MRSSPYFQLMVSVDGSASSKDCFDVCETQVALRSLMKPNYRINVLHIFNVTKEYLPFNMKPEYLHQQYESELISFFVPSRFSLTWLPYVPRKNTRDQIMNLAESYGVNLLIVGFVGRKGPKADPTILGSAVDHNLRNGHCPMLVMKERLQRRDTPENSYLWVVLVDGSERSIKAAEFAASVLSETEDRLQIFHVTKQTSVPATLQSDLAAVLDTKGVSWTFEVKDAGDGDVQSTVLDHVNKNPNRIDFIVVR